MSKAEAIFRCTPKSGKLVFDNRIDAERYFFVEQDGIELILECRQAAKLSEKMRMYNFLFGPVMNYAMRAFSNAGWEGVDKVKARYLLSAMFLKADMYNSKTKATEPYILEISGLSKERLLKFIQDCIFFLEAELKTIIPDSQEWKAMKGDGFVSMKHKKEEP